MKQTTHVPARDDPRPTLGWQVIYHDMFDRECPPSAEVGGRGLVPGLIELWERFLFETVQEASQTDDLGVAARIPSRGFSEFTLTFEHTTLSIHGSLAGAERLKAWADPALLRLIAEVHAASDALADAPLALLDAAEAAADRAAYVEQLGALRAQWRAR